MNINNKMLTQAIVRKNMNSWQGYWSMTITDD